MSWFTKIPMPTRRLINSPTAKATRWTVTRLANETQRRPVPFVTLIYASVKAGTHCREHGSHFGHPFCKWKIIMTLLTIAPADLDGPCSRVFKITPVFTGTALIVQGNYRTGEFRYVVDNRYRHLESNEYVSGIYILIYKKLLTRLITVFYSGNYVIMV